MSLDININHIINLINKNNTNINLNKLVKKQVQNAFIGNYKSKSKGSGLIFSDLKEYQAGDDVKNIHWKASARTNHIYVKTYEEEKHLNIHVLLDTSKSMLSNPFPTKKLSDLEKGINFIVSIGLGSLKNNDSFGVSLFHDTYKLISKGESGKKKLQTTLANLAKEITTSNKSNLKESLNELILNIKKRALVFIVSDFFTDDFSNELSNLSARNDVILLYLSQANKFKNTKKGLVRYKCAETGSDLLVDLSSQTTLSEIERKDTEHFEKLNILAKKYKAKCIKVVDEEIITTLKRNLKK